MALFFEFDAKMQKEVKWYYWIFLSSKHPVSSKVVHGIPCLLFLSPLLLLNLATKFRRELSGATYPSKTTKGKKRQVTMYIGP